VAVRRPRLVYIRRTRRVAVEPTLELLISNPLNPRASVVPTSDEWVLSPLISYRTLRGSDFFEPWLRSRDGCPYLVRNRAIKWSWSWQRSCAAGAPFQVAQPLA
jgi:hypothetical protein